MKVYGLPSAVKGTRRPITNSMLHERVFSEHHQRGIEIESQRNLDRRMTNFVLTLPASFNPGGSIHTMLRILKVWNLTDAQSARLLSVSQDVFKSWQTCVPAKCDLQLEIVERVSYLFGIYKALHILYTEAVFADSWIHRPNREALFDAATPLTHMLKDDISDLREVRRFLDSQLD